MTELKTAGRKVPRVLILGGGYVAIKCVRQLRSAVRRGEIELTVVDRNNYHTFHGLVPDLLVGNIQSAQVLSPARRLFAPGRFIAADVTAIDVTRKEVKVSRLLDGQETTLEYDHLVVNLGSVDDLTRYRGVGEHTMRLKSYTDCMRVRNHVLAMMEMAELETDPEERRRLLHFVVAGGNYAGIEVAAELAEALSDLTKKEFRSIRRDECKVTVIHAGPYILPELGRNFPKLIEYASKTLRDDGVTLELGVRVASATPIEVMLSDGRRLATRTIISCTGTAHHPMLDQIPSKRDGGGRLLADPFGRLSEEHQIWGAGDCAGVPMKNGQTAPPLALYAMEGGKTVGKNILRTLAGRPLKPYAFTGMGDACILGRGKAAGQLWGVPLKGFVAYLIWLSCMIVYLPLMEKRVRTLLDWITAAIFGRDIISVNAGDQMGVAQDLYEPGQVIIRQGDVGREMYIIQSGRVEVLLDGGDGPKKMAELGPGEHFGEIAVLRDVRRTATVKALDSVTLLRISRDETKMLSSALRPFAERAEAQIEARVKALGTN